MFCRAILVILVSLLVTSLHSLPVQAKTIPKLVLDDPALMLELENKGLAFHWLINKQKSANKSNAELYKQKAYRSLVTRLSRDLTNRKSADSRLGVTMRYSHRLFNAKWLRSANAHFELVGVINRMDRQPFAKDSCGEIRLIYRLAYSVMRKNHAIFSRLPFTVNMVYWARDANGEKNCSSVAHAWVLPVIGPKLLAEQLTSDSGVINSKVVNRNNLKSVEINMQSVRWPSTIRPDMGGYAEYLLRVFHLDDKNDVYYETFLENTPDVRRLKSNPALRRDLLAWLLKPKTVRAVDQGIVKVPQRFLAKKATSFALHGTARSANQPYSQIFSKKDFQSLSLGKNQYVKSPYAYLRRLNDMTCMGCHQARSVAGFHFLGIDRKQTKAVNFIHAPSSPHFMRDIHRRLQYAESLRNGKQPVVSRPFSERSKHVLEGDFGSHCGLNNSSSDKSFASWTCKTGLSCKAYDKQKNARVGECFPTPTAGSPCEVGTMTKSSNPLRDRIIKKKSLDCRDTQFCEASQVGFPGGMCSGACENLKPGETCGSIAILVGFNQCLARGGAFDVCLTNNVTPKAMRRCNSFTPCRDDYICTRTSSGTGACIPPYFLFQLRVDGHPAP